MRSAALAPTEALQETLFEELKGRLKPDDSSVPAPDGRSPTTRASAGRAAPPALPHGPRGRGGDDPARRRRARREGKAYFQIGGRRPFPRPSRCSPGAADEKGSEFYTDPRPRRRRRHHAGRCACPIPRAASSGRPTARPSSTCASTRTTGPRASSAIVVGTPASADDARLRGGRCRHVRLAVGDAVGALRRDLVHDHETSEARLVDLARARRPLPVSSRRARSASATRSSIIPRSTGRTASSFSPMPTAPRISRSSPPRSTTRAAGTGGTSRPHRLGRMILSIGVLRGLARAPRARGRAAAHRRARARDRRGARHRLRGGGLFARHGRRARVRDRHAALHLFLDDDARPRPTTTTWRRRTRVLRKRQEVPSGHDPSAYVTRRLLRPPQDGETVPISLLYRKSTRARRLGAAACSTATAPTASRCPPPSRPTPCRSSIAASSMPSPMSAAAPRRAGAGIARASSPTRRTASTTSSRPASISRPSASRRAGGSSPMAARPAAC